jgi:predicted nucleotidyltransferase
LRWTSWVATRRGYFDSNSDTSVELECSGRISQMGLVELEEYLSDVLGIKVDLQSSKT